MNQLPLFGKSEPVRSTAISETCRNPEPDEWLNAYCGWPRGFSGHDWCKRHYGGIEADEYTPGAIAERPGVWYVPCQCDCHRPRVKRCR